MYTRLIGQRLRAAWHAAICGRRASMAWERADDGHVWLVCLRCLYRVRLVAHVTTEVARPDGPAAQTKGRRLAPPA